MTGHRRVLPLPCPRAIVSQDLSLHLPSSPPALRLTATDRLHLGQPRSRLDISHNSNSSKETRTHFKNDHRCNLVRARMASQLSWAKRAHLPEMHRHLVRHLRVLCTPRLSRRFLVHQEQQPPLVLPDDSRLMALAFSGNQPRAVRHSRASREACRPRARVKGRGDRGRQYQVRKGVRGSLYRVRRGDRGSPYRVRRGDRGSLYRVHRKDIGSPYRARRKDIGSQYRDRLAHHSRCNPRLRKVLRPSVRRVGHTRARCSSKDASLRRLVRQCLPWSAGQLVQGGQCCRSRQAHKFKSIRWSTDSHLPQVPAWFSLE